MTLTMAPRVRPALTLALLTLLGARAHWQAPQQLKTMDYEFTFTDPRIIAAQSTNVVPALGAVTKSPHNPLLSEDEPHDGNWLNTNPSIVWRNGTFHLWWTAKLVCPGASPAKCTRNGAHAKVAPSEQCCHPGFNFTIPTTAHASGGLLYASSTDGVSFVRPRLGLNELLGSTQNNVRHHNPCSQFVPIRHPNSCSSSQLFCVLPCSSLSPSNVRHPWQAVWVIPGRAASQVGVFYDESVQPGVFRAFGKVFPPSAGIPPVPVASTTKMMGVASSHDGV